MYKFLRLLWVKPCDSILYGYLWWLTRFSAGEEHFGVNTPSIPKTNCEKQCRGLVLPSFVFAKLLWPGFILQGFEKVALILAVFRVGEFACIYYASASASLAAGGPVRSSVLVFAIPGFLKLDGRGVRLRRRRAQDRCGRDPMARLQSD